MAQTGYTPVQLYRSTTAAAVPLTANLAPGELAINIANTDMALFAENASGTVVRIMNNPVGLKYPTADGTAGQVITTNGSGTLTFATESVVGAAGSNTQVQYNSSGSFAGSSNLTFNGTTLTAASLTLGSALSAANGGTSLTAAGTTGNVLTSNGTTWTSASAAPTNGYRRNRIINGAMQINQRYVAASHTIPTGGAYTTDRWFAYTIGANATGQVVAGPSGYQFAYQMTGATGVTDLAFVQKIESFNVADLVNQNATISAVISNSLLTSVGWAVYSANSSDNFGAVTLVASGSWTVSPTATLYTATFNAGANAANGLQLGFVVGAQTSGTFKVTGVQLEPGSLATPFERLPVGETLSLCQRYFYSSYLIGQTPGQASVVSTFTNFSPTLNAFYTIAQSNYPSTMRASPTVVAYSPSSGAAGFYYQNNVPADASALINTTNVGFSIYANGNSPQLGGMQVNLTANAEL